MACCSDHLRVPTGSSATTVQKAEGDTLALVTDCAQEPQPLPPGGNNK